MQNKQENVTKVANNTQTNTKIRSFLAKQTKKYTNEQTILYLPFSNARQLFALSNLFLPVNSSKTHMPLYDCYFLSYWKDYEQLYKKPLKLSKWCDFLQLMRLFATGYLIGSQSWQNCWWWTGIDWKGFRDLQHKRLTRFYLLKRKGTDCRWCDYLHF